MRTNDDLRIFVLSSLIGLESVVNIVEEPIKFRLPTAAIRCTEDLLKNKKNIKLSVEKFTHNWFGIKESKFVKSIQTF